MEQAAKESGSTDTASEGRDAHAAILSEPAVLPFPVPLTELSDLALRKQISPFGLTGGA